MANPESQQKPVPTFTGVLRRALSIPSCSPGPTSESRRLQPRAPPVNPMFCKCSAKSLAILHSASSAAVACRRRMLSSNYPRLPLLACYCGAGLLVLMLSILCYVVVFWNLGLDRTEDRTSASPPRPACHWLRAWEARPAFGARNAPDMEF